MDPAPRTPSLLVTAVLIALPVLLWGIVLWVLLGVVPRFERSFQEFRLKLPASAEATVSVSRWMVKYWYVVVLMLLPGLGAVGAVTWMLRHLVVRRWPWMVWAAAQIMLPLAVVAFAWLSVWFPYVELLEGLSSQRK
jgi:type II secretory pathway component PulF